MPPQHKEEEYIDYSCSTAVERLSRDVESLLRSWHIHDGCDRHFSVTTNPNGLTLLRTERFTWIATLPQHRSAVKMELELALWDGPASRAPRSKSKSSRTQRRQSMAGTGTSTVDVNPIATSPPTPPAPTPPSSSGKKNKKLKKSKKSKKRSAKGNRRSSLSNDECLASYFQQDIAAVMAMDTGDDSHNNSNNNQHHEHRMDASTHSACTSIPDVLNEEEEPYKQHLPKSLQRPQHARDLTAMPDSLFDNFSTLFGIGQHITLTPTNPMIDFGLAETDDSSSSSSSSLASVLPASLAHLCHSLVGRHQPQQARWVMTQLLGTWMQTALNCAAQNCQSCLPVFGLWGNYPSASLPSSSEATGSSSGGSNRGNGSGSGNNSDNNNTSNNALAAFPAWLDASRALEGPLATAAEAIISDPTADQFQYLYSGGSGSGSSDSPTTSSSPRKKSSSKLASFSPKKHKRRMRLAKTQASLQNVHYTPSIVSGRVLPTSQTYANFTCHVVQHPEMFLEGPVDRLSTWGNLLLRHCDGAATDRIDSNAPVLELSAAKHVYVWSKANLSKQDRMLWRGIDPKEYWVQQQASLKHEQQQQPSMLGWGKVALPPTPAATSREEIEDYRSGCRSKALELLEKAIGSSCGWGPKEDPIRALHATAVWKSQTIAGYGGNGPIQALGSFPSPAGHDASLSFLDIERPSQFKLQTFLDHRALEPTLATNQRCVLACMVRAATLAPLTLLRHLLWDEDIIEDWDHAAGNEAALALAHEANVGEATQTLVDVMDWKTCAEEMITADEACAIVREVMDGTCFYAFASPPEDMFSVDQTLYTNSHPLLTPLFQAAPVGRLLSDLCARMAKLRTPCSMALVWSTFCNELRLRWDMREPLPQMNFVPGLDPSPATLAERRKVSTIGVKAELAAFLNCSEPDPDDQHCLIGQKLQVFNIGIETMTSMEVQAERLSCTEDSERDEVWKNDVDSGQYETSSTKDGSSSPTPARATSLVSLASDAPSALSAKESPLKSTRGGKITNLSSLGSLQLPKDLFKHNRRNRDAIIDSFLPKRTSSYDEDEEASTGSGCVSFEFFDAEECGRSIFSSVGSLGGSLFKGKLTTTVVHRIDRKGARCPLHGRSLVASGDQMYAPYLQRPEPLTDDLILERRMMLSEEYFASEMVDQDARVPVQKRLEIAYRLQKPRLLSDMNAFKAANPGAIFQDFVGWYGNPGNPLDDYSGNSGEDVSNLLAHNGLATGESVAIKLDKATEAIHILNETRNFWSSTWDEATALPAAEQRPLFEVFSTVEMSLDYLENMHPAILMNQVMAVNLSNSFFLLANSAKDAMEVDVVKKLLIRLRKQTEGALQLLAEEAGNATNAFYSAQEEDDGSASNFVSVEAVAACEAVCASLSEAEVITALATSLLQKFPGQYTVVQTILKQADGETIELKDPVAQSRILDAIRTQQQSVDEESSAPKPVLREYLLRNLDDANPCQMSVRCADASISAKSSNGTRAASLMIALTKSAEDC